MKKIEKQKISFKEWAKLMVNANTQDNAGTWALIMSILANFKDDIETLGDRFTSLYLKGNCATGKSSVAQSIRALYEHPSEPAMHLISTTDALFATKIESVKTPVICEEYNDSIITNFKFNVLKYCLLKDKPYIGTKKGIKHPNYSATPIILSQELPEKDDANLLNYLVVIDLNRTHNFSQKEYKNNMLLKEKENDSLNHILKEINNYRNLIIEQFNNELPVITRNFEINYIKHHKFISIRKRDAISLFLTLVYVIENYIPELKLPFTYKKFKSIAFWKLANMTAFEKEIYQNK